MEMTYMSKTLETADCGTPRATGARAGIFAAAVAMTFAVSAADDAIMWEGATNLTMTANVTVEVPEGTTNVIDTLAGAYTLTKTGGGTLEIRYSKSANAKIVVSEGLVRFANPRPDDIFAKAYFHVDASDLSSMVMETVGGTNFVKRWNDTDGRAHWATNCTTVWQCRTNPENRLPFLRMNFQNGLPVMDFGSLLTKHNTNEVGEALGYGAAMTFDRQSPCIKEGFSVFSDTDDYAEWPSVPSYKTAMSGMSIFSHETLYCFTRHDYSGECRLGLMVDNAQNNNYFEVGKSVWYDGSVITKHPKWITPTAGFHIVRIHPTTDNSSHTVFKNFAAEYVASAERSYGGQRIAEYVLFTNTTETGESAMTTNEAAMVNRYLRVKWFPQTIAAVTVEKGASLDVDSSSNLTIVKFLDKGAANLDLGISVTNYVNALFEPGALAHYDASATNTMTIVEEGGTNFVTRWNDFDGGANHLIPETQTGRFGQRANPEKRLPFISPTLTQNGLPIVDFGSAAFEGVTNAEGVVKGYGASFAIMQSESARANLAVAEYLSVISDTEDLKTAPTSKRGPSYISYTKGGSDYSGANAGRRGAIASNKYPALFENVSGGSPNAVCINGTNYVNGENQPYTYNPPEGFSVINLRPRSAISCNIIARTLRYNGSSSYIDVHGGQRLAEYMVFGKLLDEDNRQRIYNALRSKWFGDVPGTTNYYNNLSLGADAAMLVEYEVVSVTNKLTLAGSLAAPALAAANVEVVGSNATVSAPLTLPDGATLSFARLDDGSWPMLSATSVAAEGAVTVVLTGADLSGLVGTAVRLVATDAPPASLDGWSVSFVSSNATAHLALRADGIWVEFAGKGTAVIVR